MIMGLEQALTENEVILVDSSFKGANSSYNGHGGIGEYIFGINKFRAFDAGIIEKELQAMNEFLDILNLDCVRTTPETTTELQELETHISTKHHVLSQSLVRTPKNPRKKRHIELDEAGEYNQEIFGDLHNVIYRIVKASKKYELQKCDELCISQEAIDALKRVVCFISDLAQIKKPGSVDRDTDEKITASAFYFSMYSDKKPAVFTSDGDFYGLMSFVPRMMACRYFMPYNAEFRRAMKRNPPKLYLKEI